MGGPGPSGAAQKANSLRRQNSAGSPRICALVLSASIPEAFESRALTFAGAYVVMQVGRSLFMLWALRGLPAWLGW
jgi:hypothetical protein